MSATIYDVAERAGVSTATVSRVLNGTKRVRESTRSKVMAAVRDLGYRPNVAARSLAGRGTHTLALVFANMVGTFAGEVVRGAELAACEADYHLLVLNAGRRKVLTKLLGSHHHGGVGRAAASVSVGSLLGAKPFGHEQAAGPEALLDAAVEPRAVLGREVEEGRHHRVPRPIRRPRAHVCEDRIDGDPCCLGQALGLSKAFARIVEGRHGVPLPGEMDGVAPLSSSQG